MRPAQAPMVRWKHGDLKAFNRALQQRLALWAMLSIALPMMSLGKWQTGPDNFYRVSR